MLFQGPEERWGARGGTPPPPQRILDFWGGGPEGEEVDMIYFMLNGEANYVLTRYDNTAYIKLGEGDQGRRGTVKVLTFWM